MELRLAAAQQPVQRLGYLVLARRLAGGDRGD